MEKSSLWQKITQNITVSHFLYIREGIKTGISREKEETKDPFVLSATQKKEYEIEEEAIKPLVRVKNVHPFQYKWKNDWIIWTNQPNFEERFPNTMDYLQNHKIILERRGSVWVFSKKWWELEESPKEQCFKREKIITPLITRKNSFTLDKREYFYLDNCIFSYLRPIKEIKKHINSTEASTLLDLEDELNLYLLGILNSQVLEWFFRKKIQRTSFRKGIQGKFYWYTPECIRRAPIPTPSQKQGKNVIRIVKHLLEHGKNNSSTTEKTFRERKLELDELVFDIFKLEEKEKAKIQVALSR